MYIANPKNLRAEIDLTRCHAAVVMSHHLPSDEAYLRELAEAGRTCICRIAGTEGAPQPPRAGVGAGLCRFTARPNSRSRAWISRRRRTTPEGVALAITGQIHAWLAGRGYSEAVLT